MIPSWFAEYRPEVLGGLRRAVAGDGLLFDMVRDHLGLDGRAEGTGKLVRSSLVLFTIEALGGRRDEALPAAVALELIHGFSLVHDDIQDRDETRRGRPTLWSQYGVAQAINAGDLLHALAAREAARAGAEAALILAAATGRMIEGQSLDLQLEARRGAARDVLQMIDGKTGALLSCALELPASLVGAAPKTREALAAAGIALGRAFQIRDDLLGVWGDGAALGKPVGSDVRRRKTSYAAAVAFERASGALAEQLATIYSSPPTDAQVSWVVDCFTRLGVREACQTAIEQYAARAKAKLDEIPVSPASRNGFDEFLSYLCGRST
ncbi:MAG: polyprenyl synthetase family protein [Candidatus Bipolaricaulota bacterium]